MGEDDLQEENVPRPPVDNVELEFDFGTREVRFDYQLTRTTAFRFISC